MAQTQAAKALKVLIGGGTGFIGKHVSGILRNRGHQVTVLSRTSGPGRLTWRDLEKTDIGEFNATIQLSGAPILEKPWTEDRKKELLASRVDLTKLLVSKLENSDKPHTFVQGSAIGFYPTTKTAQFDESYSGPPPNNFAGELVSKLEAASEPLTKNNNIRRVLVRTGIVLGRDGGAFSQLLLPLGLAYAGKMGSGNQYYPWIHIEDIAHLFAYCVEHNVTGVVNGVAPHAVTNGEFASILGKVSGKFTVPAPEFVVKTMFKERAFMILEGSKILPTRTLESGFKFEYPTLESAIKEITHK
jgi:hypothetical protein